MVREKGKLQILAVLKQHVEVYVCDFCPFLPIQFRGYDRFRLFSGLTLSPHVILTAPSSLLAFFAFLCNNLKH